MAKNKLMGNKKSAPAPAMGTPSKDYAAEDAKWRAEEDMRTLSRAEEIRADKARMKCVSDHAKKQVDTLKKFC